MKRLLYAELAALAAMSAVAGLGFQRVFVGHGFAGPVIGAAILAVCLSTAASVRKLGPAPSMLLSAGGFVLYTTYAVLGDTAPNVIPTFRTFRDLLSGVTGGWAELLTISLPARAEPKLVVLAVALTWAGAAGGAELAVRSRSAVASVAPPLATYSATLAFAAAEPPSSLAVPLGVAGLALLCLLLHANRWAVLEPAGLRASVDGDEGADRVADGAGGSAARTVAGRRRAERAMQASVDVSADRWVLIGLPVIGVAVAVAALLGPALPVRHNSFDPRSLRNQDVAEQVVGNPLASLKAELKRDPANPPVAFTFETPTFRDANAVPRVRLAVLDTFDGATWSSSARYGKVGSILPAGEKLTVPTRPIRQRFTISRLDLGPWLPAADRPVNITAGEAESDIAFDPTTGTLISKQSVVDGLSYDVVSEVPQFSEANLANLVPPTGDALRPFAKLPEGLPEELKNAAKSYTASAPTAYGKLKALEAALAGGFGYSEDVEPGHSYGRLAQFVSNDRSGYAEQFAATFAVLGRELGFPTRLALGYLTVEPGTTDSELNVLTDITSRQAHVWPEVYLQGAGWVPFEPTPERVSSEAPPKQDQPQQAAGSGFTESQEQPQSGAAETGGGQEQDKPALSAGWLAVLTLLATLILLLVVLIVAKMLLRRSLRRSSAGAAEQVLGAWAAVTDRLLEVGVPVARSMTAREVVAASRPVVAPVATDRLDAMVPLVTLALYAPVPPAEDRAEEMWAHADAFHREVLTGQRWWSALRAWLNPRPLLRRVSLGR